MVNLTCYIILKLAYFVCFDKLNAILDETILLMMKMVSFGMAALSVFAEIGWKVWQRHASTEMNTIHPLSFRFTKNNIY